MNRVVRKVERKVDPEVAIRVKEAMKELENFIMDHFKNRHIEEDLFINVVLKKSKHVKWLERVWHEY